MTNQKYPAKIKNKVIKLIESGKSSAQISRDLNIPVATIKGWKKKLNNKNNLNDNSDFMQCILEGDDLKALTNCLFFINAILSKNTSKKWI